MEAKFRFSILEGSDNKAKVLRKVKDGIAFDVKESKEIQLGLRDEIYVKS